MLVVAFSIVSMRSANAHCRWDVPWWSSAGWGEETVAYASTCDGDLYYVGKVHDTATDGAFVFFESWPSTGYFKSQPSYGEWVQFTYYDNNSFAYFRLCKELISWPYTRTCATTGSNYGF